MYKAIKREPQNNTKKPIQMLKIGTKDHPTIDSLTSYLNLSKEEILEKINAKIERFPKADIQNINNFLKSKKSKLTGANISPNDNYDNFFIKLSESYKRSYIKLIDPTFYENIKNIKNNIDYKNLVNPSKDNYLEGGGDDGVSITDTYNKSLACTLFALLELKPKLLNASTPEQLHYVLRSNPKTKRYDNDREVAQIRIASGLTPVKPTTDENTISKFTCKHSSGESFIIDPAGEAHTYILKKVGSTWKKIDNDHPEGITPTNDNIRFYWKA